MIIIIIIRIINLYLWVVRSQVFLFQVLLLWDSRCMLDTHDFSPLPIILTHMAATWAGSPLFIDDLSTTYLLGIQAI